MSAVGFGRREEDLTADLLTAVLAVRTPGVRVDAVEVVATKRCGDGIASTADRMVLDLTYAEGSAGDLPERLVLKTMLVSPHAPAEMYETEVRFYNELRPSLSVETPHCYAASFDPATGQFGLLLEDLTERGRGSRTRRCRCQSKRSARCSTSSPRCTRSSGSRRDS